ncbi:oxygenase MpaB family protein [Naasia lichenicola]|uniref:DUF2236 domain-containing protein n=1 Tax=Naasia lichenicola TaxID=2565933 RepID=A0A4V3WSJ3_9MICO|nr:oxygenase MpaB family protein [Naasia lichenicola]THG28137.1 DUF2236 domain-containing protein [Naasia lichenicola]
MARAPHLLNRRSAPIASDRSPFAAVAGEGALLLGGGRALLLQLADPRVAAGVARHSAFATDPLKRLTGTLTYLYVLAFGTEAEIARVARSVGGAHRGVQGADPVAYDARDVDLQLWVAATLYESTVAMHELFVRPLSEAEADLTYAESARIGTALGMPAAAWPADRDAFAGEWERMLGGLEVSDEARSVAGALMRPTAVPRVAHLIMPVIRLLTAGMLPPELRAGYGIRWTPRHQLRYERAIRRIRAVYRVLPHRFRTLPARLTLRRFRATL